MAGGPSISSQRRLASGVGPCFLVRAKHRRNCVSWAERFLWTALTLRMISDPSGCWREMALIAHELLNGRPLRDIPAMVNVAHLTVEAHLARRLWGA